MDLLTGPPTLRSSRTPRLSRTKMNPQPILNGSVDLLLFVKREDAEGTDFYYLGQVDAENARQTVMRGNKGEDLDVVITDLKIRVPIDSSLFDIITANKLVDQHGK